MDALAAHHALEGSACPNRADKSGGLGRPADAEGALQIAEPRAAEDPARFAAVPEDSANRLLWRVREIVDVVHAGRGARSRAAVAGAAVAGATIAGVAIAGCPAP